jgi:hypothetical protein
MCVLVAIACAQLQQPHIQVAKDLNADAAARGLHFGELKNHPHAINMNRLQSGYYKDDDDEADERYGFRNGPMDNRGVVGTGLNIPLSHQQNRFQQQQQQQLPIVSSSSSGDSPRFGEINRNSQQGFINRL